MPFSPIKPAKLSRQVATTLRSAIVSGDYTPGDPLPTERSLAAQFGVNRSSIREALRHLESWGLVEIRHGAGARVADFLATAGLQLLPFLLAPGGQLDPQLLADLLELRVELLGWTAAQAAARADPSGVAELAAVLALLEASEPGAPLQALDYRFFTQLVDMTGNRVLAMLANAIGKVYLENRALFSSLYAAGFETTHHQRTLEAVRRGDAAAARAAMSDYGERALQRLQ